MECPRELFPPEVYWPESAPLEESVGAFVKAFELLGYKRCSTAEFEFGYQKVAIYAYSNGIVAHMARQHLLGKGWLSKLGNLEDIVHHDLYAIEGSVDPQMREYGEVVQILKRTWLRGITCDFWLAWWSELKFLYARMKMRGKGWLRDF